MGANALVSATVVAVTLKEPQRGAKEEDLAEVLSKGEKLICFYRENEDSVRDID